MKKPKVHIEYFISGDGGRELDFLDEFRSSVSENYKIHIGGKNSGAAGGSNYEFLIQIYNDITLHGFIADYVVEGAKYVVGAAAAVLWKSIKTLFEKNKTFRPDIGCVEIVFLDASIFIYSILRKSVTDELIAQILEKLTQHYAVITNRIGSKITAIHIPIFNHVDSYNLCAFRVLLDVDENIENVTHDDYFAYWGVRCGEDQYIYDLKQRTTLHAKFYTQREYEHLFHEKHSSQ